VVADVSALPGDIAVVFPDDGQRAAIDAAIAKFQTTLAEVQDDHHGRQQCREAANELMTLLQALVNRMRS